MHLKISLRNVLTNGCKLVIVIYMNTHTNINEKAHLYFNDQFANYIGDGFTQDEAEEFANIDLERWQKLSALLPSVEDSWEELLLDDNDEYEYAF